MDRITADTVRQLAAAVGIRPEEERLAELAASLGSLLGAIERCDELNLAKHEPANIFHLTGGPTDAEL